MISPAPYRIASESSAPTATSAGAGRALAPQESPALAAARSPGVSASELKFALSEPQAIELEALLSPHLTRDPHSRPELDGAYLISTLYTDTPQFDVFRRRGPQARRKLRVRRYGVEPSVFLEIKSRRGRRVSKRRATVNADNLPRLEQRASSGDWAGDGFLQELHAANLRPVCQISYLRRAYFGADDLGPVRFTLDRGLCGLPSAGWEFSASSEFVTINPGRVVGELKFHGALPRVFKTAIRTLQLIPGGFSKYRYAVRTLGLCPASEEPSCPTG